MSAGAVRPGSEPGLDRWTAPSDSGRLAGYGPTVVLTVTIVLGSSLILMSLILVGWHQRAHDQLFLQGGQPQSAKTAVYVAAFAVILPVSVLFVPRLADAIAGGPNGGALLALVALLAATLAAAIVLVKLSSRLPWGDGVGTMLAVVGVWAAIAVMALRRAARHVLWTPLQKLGCFGPAVSAIALALVLAAVLCVTRLRSLSVLTLVLGAAVAFALLVAYDRVTLPSLTGLRGRGMDLIFLVLLLLAIPDVVIFQTSAALPNAYFPPGVIQFQHDYLLGSANQLLGGGALLVNVPVSQYGVGSIYFVAAFFHLVPIGYGTFGLLDGILTALFYAVGYCVLRIAGVGRLLAGAALGMAVVAFLYNLPYSVGALPEEGPLRFGLPMVVVLAAAVSSRWPRRARIARAAALAALAVAAIWALEAFAYTAATFVAVVLAETWLMPSGRRGRRVVLQLASGAAACLAGQVILAAATLAATGHLPDWGQYLAYVHAFVLGGSAGKITYGFARWSPGLAVGAGCLASAAAIVLLIRRAPAVARNQRTWLIAVTGMTVYAIVLLSYTDNRSSTYLFNYVALPPLIAGALWLSLLLRSRRDISYRGRVGGLAFGFAVAVVMLAAAWPAAGVHFSRSALAHAYPGGGLRVALRRLVHPPPIDPRAPAGERLLDTYMPGKRVIVVLPTAPDLGTEILMRSRRANAMFIGDPKADTDVPPREWTGKLTAQIGALRTGDRMLTDRTGLAVTAALRGRPSDYPLKHPLDDGNQQLEWILHRIDVRFELKPIHYDPAGFVVVQLAAR